MKKGLLCITATAVLALAAASVVSGRSASSAVFRLGTSSRIDSLNPYVAFNQDAYSMFEYIYPFLVQYDQKTLRFAPDFAVSWKTSQGGKVWTFRTRANARWSDGQPLTAADAAWTINTDIKYQASGAANAAGLIAHIVRAEAPNPTTLVVRYKEAAGNVLGQFQQLAILPEHIWSGYTGHKGNDLKTFANGAPVVSGGPFTLTSYKKDEIALFARNDSFYGRKPVVDGFGLRIYANDDAMISALKHNELDAVESVPPTAIKTLQSAGFAVRSIRSLHETDFINNSNPKKTGHRELLDLRVREALAHAIDRKQIVNVVYLGHAQPAASFIPPASGSWSNPSLKPEKFDLALANRMLDGLGYKKGGDGIRVAGDHKMSYEVIDPTDVQSVPRTFQIIQTSFAKIGVKLTLKPLDSSAAFDAITAPNGKYLDFDFAMWDWTALVDPDFMLSVLTCGQYNGWSDTGYCNPAYDKLYSKQQLTPNQNKRRAVVWAMQKLQVTERPYTMLVYTDQIDAVSKKWAGLSVTPQGPFNSLSKQSLTEVHQVG